jgi:hypothetical protein
LNNENETPQPEFFDHVWSTLAAAGFCGAIASPEYQRVRQAWLNANQPCDISRFITHHSAV